MSAVLAVSAAAAAAADIGDSVGLKDYFGAERPPPKPPAAFRFSSAYSDDMVLQQAPAQAVVWGFAPAGSKVTIGFGGKSIDAPVAPYMGESAFMTKLPATPSSMTQELPARLRAGARKLRRARAASAAAAVRLPVSSAADRAAAPSRQRASPTRRRRRQRTCCTLSRTWWTSRAASA